MITRCHRPANKHYAGYGARGIRVCEQWRSFDVFEAWALNNGYAPNLTIERKKNTGNYEPDNCCWATPLEQAQNRRTTVLVTAFGETKSIHAWTEDPRCKVQYRTLCLRIARGVDAETAILQPSRRWGGNTLHS
jgi:hypothetical protein